MRCSTMLDNMKQVSVHYNSSKHPWVWVCPPLRFHLSIMRSPPPRLQAHLYKHPADAELYCTTALFKAEKVHLCSKVVVIHLLWLCGGDGLLSSEGSDGAMSTGFERPWPVLLSRQLSDSLLKASLIRIAPQHTSRCSSPNQACKLQ